MQMNQTIPDVTIDNCDKEPIHILGRIQSHGFLIVCRRATAQIVQISQNATDYTGMATELLLQSNLADLLEPAIYQKLRDASQKESAPSDPIWTFLVPNVQVGKQATLWNLIAHTAHDIAPDLMLVEFEPMADETDLQQYYQWPQQILQLALSSDSLEEIFNLCAMRIKEFTGFDRVMVYRFGEEWHGEVIAEAKNAELEPYLGLHYPASDIPAQARQLYVRNLVRIIADVDSQPSSFSPSLTPREKGGESPLNLSDSSLRAVSPIHIEYLQNMGVKTSMSISILQDGKLWGLFACHHYHAKFVDYNLRSICRFISTILSGFLETKLTAFDSRYLAQLTSVNETLMTQMLEADYWVNGLTDAATTILEITNCTGVAVHLDEKIVLLGKTPSRTQLASLAGWIESRYKDGLFTTDRLSWIIKESATPFEDSTGSIDSEHSGALSEQVPISVEDFSDCITDIAGVMAIQLMKNTSVSILWFRPEVLQTVKWAGKPTKEMAITNDIVHLSPRKSFETWSQDIEGKSLPWKLEEIEAVRRLSSNIQSVIVSHTMQVDQINEELRRTNHELEAFSYSVAHDLRAPLRHIDSYAEILYDEYKEQLDDEAIEILKTILTSSARMKKLVHDLLAYSRVGRSKKIYNSFAARALVDEVLTFLLEPRVEKRIEVQINSLPDLYGDHPMMRQVFSNILDNAIKYSSREPEPKIEIGGYEDAEMATIYVKDNGVGFDMKYAENAFRIFSRLHSDDEFEGTGTGLAIVERVIGSHHGKTWIESAPTVGTTIYFSVPKFLEEMG